MDERDDLKAMTIRINRSMTDNSNTDNRGQITEAS